MFTLTHQFIYPCSCFDCIVNKSYELKRKNCLRSLTAVEPVSLWKLHKGPQGTPVSRLFLFHLFFFGGGGRGGGGSQFTETLFFTKTIYWWYGDDFFNIF